MWSSQDLIGKLSYEVKQYLEDKKLVELCIKCTLMYFPANYVIRIKSDLTVKLDGWHILQKCAAQSQTVQRQCSAV